MNRLIRKFLFGDADIKEFSSVTVNDQIKETVLLKAGHQVFNVSESQFLLCLEPVVFGVWLTNEKKLDNMETDGIFEMLFTRAPQNKLLARIKLNFFDKISDDKGSLFVLKQVESEIHHIGILKARFLFSRFYKKPGFLFAQFKLMVAAYSYPRKVRLISFRQGDYYNIFPMDLLGDIKTADRYVFGLRNTNTTLKHILETKKLIVSDVSHLHKQAIYQLGSHHSVAPPQIAHLPFAVIKSKAFNFYIPEWADSYKEITIKKTINLGSHTLLWGEVETQCNLKSSTGHLHHIHYLLHLYQKKKGNVYPSA